MMIARVVHESEYPVHHDCFWTRESMHNLLQEWFSKAANVSLGNSHVLDGEVPFPTGLWRKQQVALGMREGKDGSRSVAVIVCHGFFFPCMASFLCRLFRRGSVSALNIHKGRLSCRRRRRDVIVPNAKVRHIHSRCRKAGYRRQTSRWYFVF